MTRVVVFAVAIVAGMLAGSVALADGEAGLVIQYAEGQTDTYCLAFEGDSVSGAELLQMAGLPVNQFSGVVCAIGGTGCTHSGSFDSCTCECKAGAGDCTYWSYFTQPYGETWRYSVLGFQSAKARDGDLQGWRWGEGSAASAPPPGATTFEAVCGHAPGGASTAVPASTVPPANSAGSPTALPTATPRVEGVTPTSTGAPSTASGTQVVTPPAATSAAEPSPSTPEPPATGEAAEKDAGSGGGSGGLTAFGVAVGILVAAIGAGAYRRRRRGD